MKVRSPVCHSDAVEALTNILGFRIIREEGLQTEMRKGKVHVVVRTFHGAGGTEIRFHEDRGQGSHRLVLERSGRLLKFRQRLEAALEKQKLIKEASNRKFEEAFLEAVKSHGCPFYRDCPHFKELPLTYCITKYRYCDEYRRRDKLQHTGQREASITGV